MRNTNELLLQGMPPSLGIQMAHLGTSGSSGNFTLVVQFAVQLSSWGMFSVFIVSQTLWSPFGRYFFPQGTLFSSFLRTDS